MRRTYGVSLTDGVLRVWGSFPEFAQRYSATLGRDCFQGLWQVARTPGDWQDDLKVTCRRGPGSTVPSPRAARSTPRRRSPPR